MSDVAAVAEGTPTSSAPQDYDAFLSYAHRDRAAVSGIQKNLHRIGRRMGQLRALRVFRDDTDLTASPDLWGRITDAMDRSRYFVVTLSPEAANSHWVNEEISYWIEHRGLEHLMVVLASGHLGWKKDTECFDPQVSDAAPPALTASGSLPAEPLYIDISGDAPWEERSATFREKITALAAPIHGKSKDALVSDDLREQRRFRRLRAAAVAGLALLTVAAVVASFIAVGQRQNALQQRNSAIALRLNAEAKATLAGIDPDGDIVAFQKLLAARTVALPDEGALLHAATERSATLKVVDTGTPVETVALSPDGRRLATGGDDNTVRLWDADTGQPIGKPFVGHTDWVMSVEFSPDGHRLASASADKTVRLWDADTGQPIGEPLTGHTDAVNSVAFSPDGHRLATGSDDDTLRLWDADTGQPIGQPAHRPHRLRCISVAFSPDGRRLATGSGDDTVRLWDADTGQPIGEPLTGHTEGVRRGVQPRRAPPRLRQRRQDRAAVGRRHRPTRRPTPHRPHRRCEQRGVQSRRPPLATGSGDDTVRLWDADTGQPIGAPFAGHTNEVLDVVVQPRRSTSRHRQ